MNRLSSSADLSSSAGLSPRNVSARTYVAEFRPQGDGVEAERRQQEVARTAMTKIRSVEADKRWRRRLGFAA
jgi:hypothetical protein